jgi:Domain of Unknown Function (DUF1080)
MDFFSRKRQSPTVPSPRVRVADVARRQASFAAALLLAVGCAEVTQDEPESQLGPLGGGGSPTGDAGSAGLGGTGVGQGGTGLLPLPNAGSGGASAGSGNVGTSGAGGTPGSGAQGGSGLGSSGSAGQGGSVADPGPQFPSGTELFREDFESEDVSRWNLAGGTWARTLDAETNSNVFSQSDAQPSDTLLAVAGDVSWRDVRVEADFKVLAFNGSSSSYMAGICLRLTDGENFYLVGLRGDSNQHIGIRLFGDNNTTLSESEEFAGVENEWYRLRVDAVGSTLSVFVDDELVLEQTDSEHPAGGIGLCTTRATAAFDNILVTAP